MSAGRQHRWFRFRLRTFLAVVAAIALLLGWRAERVRRFEHAVKRTRDLGGYVVLSADAAPWSHWFKLPRVESITLDDTAASDGDLAVIAHLKHVSRIKLSGTQISQGSASELAPLRGISLLDLSHTNIGDADAEQIARFTSLNRLELEHTAFSDAGLEELRGLTALVKLSIEGSAVTASGLKHLTSLSALSELSLDEAQLTKESVDWLKQLPSLSKIEVYVEQGIGSDGRQLLRRLAGVEVVGLSGDGTRILWASNIPWERCTAGVTKWIAEAAGLGTSDTEELLSIVSAAKPNGTWERQFAHTQAGQAAPQVRVANPIRTNAEFIEALRTGDRSARVKEFAIANTETVLQTLLRLLDDKQLDDADCSIRQSAIWILAEIGKENEQVFDLFTRLLNSDEATLRSTVGWVFLSVVPVERHEEALAILLGCVNDPDWQVRSAVASHVGKIVEQRPKTARSAFPSLVKLFELNDPWTFNSVLHSIERIAAVDDTCLEDGLRKFATYVSGDEDTAKPAAQVLGSLHSIKLGKNPFHIRDLLTLARDGDAPLASVAKSAISKYATRVTENSLDGPSDQ